MIRTIHTGTYSFNIPEPFPQVKQLGNIVKAETLTLQEGEGVSASIGMNIGEQSPGQSREQYLEEQLKKAMENSWATTVIDKEPLSVNGLEGMLYILCADKANEYLPRMFYYMAWLFIDGYALRVRCECNYDFRDYYAPYFRYSIYSIQYTSGNVEEAFRQDTALVNTALEATFNSIAQQAEENRRKEEAARKEAKARNLGPLQQLDDEQLALQLREYIQQCGLQAYEAELLQTARPCIYVHTIAPDDYSHTGNSRFGGVPDWPADREWPRDESGFYLNFHAQINLAEIAHLQQELPSRGMLYFFNGLEQGKHYVAWYDGPLEQLRRYSIPDTVEEDQEIAEQYRRWDSEARRMVFTPPPDAPITVSRDEQGYYRFTRDGDPVMLFSEGEETDLQPYRVLFRKGYSLPGYGTPAYRRMKLSEDRDMTDHYLELCDRYNNSEDKDNYAHQLFGYPFFQGGEKWEPARRAAEAAKDPALQDPADWFLLLGIASDAWRKVGFCFGDYGDSYYMANRKAVARKDFEHVWGMVESS